MVKPKEEGIYVSAEKLACNLNGYRTGTFLVLHGRARTRLLFEGTNIEQHCLLVKSLSFFDS